MCILTGPRDTTIFTIKKSRGRREKVTLLAPRLGARAHRISGVSRVEATQHTRQVMRFMQAIRRRMLTSTTNADTKNSRIERKANIQAIHHYNWIVLSQSIHWCLCDAAIYRANI